AVFDGNLTRAAREFAVAASVFRAAGDIRWAGGAGANLGVMYLQLGLFEKAEAALRSALADAERVGAAYSAALAKQNLASSLLRLQRPDEALELQREALEVFVAGADVRLAVMSHCGIAEAYLEKREVDPAYHEASAACRAAADFLAVRGQALAVYAQVLLASGRPEEALVRTSEGISLLESHPMEEREMQLRATHIAALRACGHAAVAEEEVRAAKTVLAERAQKIEDASQRAVFLQRVAENRAIAEM
ncbi:MAG: tetratricopeptide repeat protein, partial [Myxococcota bacterium]